MRPFDFTLYASKTARKGEPHQLPWEEWCRLFSTRDVRTSKDGPAVVCGYVPAGVGRAKDAVAFADAIAIDLDKDPRTKQPLAPAQIEAVFTTLAPFESFTYTTHSHTPSEPRLRIIVPFAQPIGPVDYPGVWAGLNDLIGGVNDPQTKDISRLSFLPSCPPGAERHAMHWRNASGRLLSVEDLSTNTSASASRRAPYQPLSARVVASEILRLSRGMPRADPVKGLLTNLVAGDLLATPGARHQAIVDATWWIASKGIVLDEQGIHELFAASITAMAVEDPKDPPTVQEAWAAYEGALGKVETEDPPGGVAAALRAQAGVAGPYDEEELRSIAAQQGWDPDALADRWIVQRDGSHWILDPSGEYVGPLTEKDAVVATRRLLSRAPIQLVNVTRNGTSYRAFADVVTDAGQVAKKVISDMTTQHTTFDPVTGTIHEAVCPLRPLVPAFDPQIDEWLKVLAGPLYGKLVDWLSCVPDLSKLLCAIYLDGPKGAGKSLLPTALARLWTEGPPGDLEVVLSDYNDEIARCPILFADEELPKPYRAMTVTTKLRAMIATSTRTLKRKFKGPSELQGAIRLVLAANNEFLLDTKDVATARDLDAIAQRFLYIHASQTASEYIDGLPRETKHRWLREGIAQHTLWLRDHHEIQEPGKRLWVEGDVAQMHRLLMTGSRWNSLACEWLVRYCMEPQLFDSMASGFVRRNRGQLLVNEQALIDGWGLYIKNTKSEPETAKIGAALRAISRTDHRPHLRHNGRRIRYRDIDVNHLLDWSDRYNVGDAATILESVGAPVPDELRGEGGDDTEDLASMPAAHDERRPM